MIDMDSDSLSRRGLLGAGAAAGAAAAIGARAGDAAAADKPPTFRQPRTPAEALRVLRQGNRRWQRGQRQLRIYSPVAERHEEGQAPFASILTCADSRMSTTLIFDLHRGSLFVPRVAGNTADVGMLGSTEYAVAVLGVKLVMVLGHSNCGAVKAALGVADGSMTYPPDQFGAIGAFVDAVVPAIESLPPDQRTLERATAANARAQAAKLAASEPIIKPAVDAGKIRVVAAVYDIKTGRVTLL
jgi:carbonic anhydrase